MLKRRSLRRSHRSDRSHLNHCGHAPQIELAGGDLRPVAIKLKLVAVKSCRQQMPFPRINRGRFRKAVVIAHPEDRVTAIQREIPRKFVVWISDAGDQSHSLRRFGRSHPRVERPRRIRAQHRVILYQHLLKPIPARKKLRVERPIIRRIVRDRRLRIAANRTRDQTE